VFCVDVAVCDSAATHAGISSIAVQIARIGHREVAPPVGLYRPKGARLKCAMTKSAPESGTSLKLQSENQSRRLLGLDLAV
jgi:hypothetical protein